MLILGRLYDLTIDLNPTLPIHQLNRWTACRSALEKLRHEKIKLM
jgi:hypothetical protein